MLKTINLKALFWVKEKKEMRNKNKSVAKKEVSTAAPVMAASVATAQAAASKADAKAEESASKVVVPEVKKEETVEPAEAVKKEEKPVENVAAKAEEKPVAEKKKPGRKPGRKPASEKAVKKASKKDEQASVEEVYFEYNQEQIFSNELVERIKLEYKNEGHRISSIKSLKVYVNVEDRKAYYVINDKAEGKFVEF